VLVLSSPPVAVAAMAGFFGETSASGTGEISATGTRFLRTRSKQGTNEVPFSYSRESWLPCVDLEDETLTVSHT
jgi:hypothetical protein